MIRETNRYIAKMEYYYNKDPATASRVFQAGLKKFALGQDTQLCGLLNNYLDFLISLNDDSSTCVYTLK